MSDDPKALLQRYQPKEVKVLKTDRQMAILRFSPCGNFLAAGGCDATVRRWDVSNAEMAELPPLTGHGGWVQALAFSPPPLTLLPQAGERGGSSSPSPPEGERGRGEGRLFTADSWGRLTCWPYAEKEAQPLWSVEQAHDGWVRGLAVSPDGKLLATCGMDQKVRLWSADDGAKKQELAGHNEDIYAVAFHPDGKSLVSGDLKGVIQVWDLESGKVVRRFDAKQLYLLSRLQDVGGVRCLAFDAKGETLAAAGTKPKVGANVQGVPTILFFDWSSGQVKHTLSIGNDGDGYIFDLHLHPAGFVMAVTSGNPGVGKLFFQRPADPQPFFLYTKMANCHSLAVHPNGQRLAVSATNANSNGNGRQIGKGTEYPGNYSPIHVFDLPTAG
ncbi:MAG TPA: hypothetical protein VNK04_00430 [Gemmataceae bacterium]|nr:hypothetical protein [Gemmataceae bacterium]